MSPAASGPVAPVTSASASNGPSEVPSPPAAAVLSTYQTRGVAGTLMVIVPVSVGVGGRGSLSLRV